jgi:hypothetical protein
MADFHPRCPKCEKLMDRGHLPDAAAGGQIQIGAWAPGDPEPRRFVGGIKYHADRVIPLAAYRCSACGYVELYARPA